MCMALQYLTSMPSISGGHDEDEETNFLVHGIVSLPNDSIESIFILLQCFSVEYVK